MGSARPVPDPITTALAGTVGKMRRAVRAVDPAHPPSLAQLRAAGRQLSQLIGELSDLAALLAEHTGRYLERPKQIRSADGVLAIENLAHAYRELATLRQGLDAAHGAARSDYAVSPLHPTHARDPAR